MLKFVKQHPPSLMLVAGHWPFVTRPDEYKPYLAKSLAALRDLGVKTVVLGPPIEYTRPLPELIVRSARARKPLHTSEFIDKTTKNVEREMKKGVVELSGAKLVSLFDLMCDRWECPALTPEHLPLQWDTRHLTYEGSIMTGRKLFPILEAALNERSPSPL